METFSIVIDGKTYEYITSKKIDGVDYVAYADEQNIYIAKYKIIDNQISLEPVEEDKINLVKEAMNIE